jgi:DNA-binding response OmpR family regulator
MSAPPDFSPPRRVLIVDADVGMRESAASLLKLQGFEVAAAADGIEALTMFAREWFPVVVTDSSVPAVDGIEFIARLRILSLAPVYLIMLTEISEVRFQEHGYCMGVDQYLMRQNALSEVVGRVLAGVNAIRRRQSSKTGRAHEPSTVDLENGAHTARHLVGRLRAEIVQAGRTRKTLQLLSIGLDAADAAAFHQHDATNSISDTLLGAAHDAVRPKLDWVVRLPAPANTCRLVVVMPESGATEASAMEQTVRNAFVHWGLSSAANGIRLSTGLAAFAGEDNEPAALELLGQAERSRRTNDSMSRSSAARSSSESIPAQDAA